MMAITKSGRDLKPWAERMSKGEWKSKLCVCLSTFSFYMISILLYTKALLGYRRQKHENMKREKSIHISIYIACSAHIRMYVYQSVNRASANNKIHD